MLKHVPLITPKVTWELDKLGTWLHYRRASSGGQSITSSIQWQAAAEEHGILPL